MASPLRLASGGGDFDRTVVADTLLDDIKKRETFGSELVQVVPQNRVTNDPS